MPLQLRVIIYSFRPQFNEWTSAYFYATDILILAVLSLWLIRKIKQKGQSFFDFKSAWAEVGIFLFWLVSGASLLLSNNFWLSFYSWLKLLEFGLLFLYVKYNFHNFNLKRFWQIFAASAVFQSVVAVWQFFSQKSLGLKLLAESPLSPDISGVAKIIVNGKKIIRAYGLVPHPNILAAILILAIFGLTYLFIKNYASACNSRENGNPDTDIVSPNAGNSGFRLGAGMTKKIVCFSAYVFLFVLLSASLFFTFSRSVTLISASFLMVWLAVIYVRQKEFRRPAVSVVVLILAISFLLLVVYWPYVSASYDVIALGRSQAVSLRAFYIQTAWLLIKASPVLGIGQGNFVWTFANLGLFENWVYQPVHNIYFLIAAETGILGLFAFFWFLFKIIRSVYLKRKENKDKTTLYCFLGIILFLLAIGLFDHFLWDLQQGQLILWIMLGILASFGVKESAKKSL